MHLFLGAIATAGDYGRGSGKCVHTHLLLGDALMRQDKTDTIALEYALLALTAAQENNYPDIEARAT
ncbi:MAG: hypothetical protein IPM69_15650, partial [Ignavibacteria bacterium]|nr:hypothetical protein [Ignavibacteria bacterium]